MVIVHLKAFEEAAETDRPEAILKALPEGVLYGTYIINIVIVHPRGSEKAIIEIASKAPPTRALRAGRHLPLYLRHIWSIFAILFIFGEDTRNVAKILHGPIRLFEAAQHPYVARNHVVYRRYEGAPRKTSALRGDEA